MRIMGNLYTDNLIGTVIGLSVADDWEGARREWEIVGCEVDETHSATCVCGKEGLRYVYTIANTETGEILSPIGSSCIKKFEQSDTRRLLPSSGCYARMFRRLRPGLRWN